MKELHQKAEAANRAKEEFLAMLSHELRNPLAPIMTALELMRFKGGNAFTEERALIERQTKQLAVLVDDLLDISRIKLGKIELKKELLEVKEVVATAIETVSPLLEQRRHRLHINVSAGLIIEGDRYRMTQVIANLLNNAAKYTEPGGEIRICGEKKGREIIITVADNGVGISENLLELLSNLVYALRLRALLIDQLPALHP